MADDLDPIAIGARNSVLATLLTVARALEAAGAPFLVGGSLASSLQGIPRSTQDVDLVADLARWAGTLELADLLSRAFVEAGIAP